MLTRRERKVLHAVVAVLVPNLPPLGDQARAGVLSDVAEFLTSQIARMPVTLRLPYRMTLAVFDLVPVLLYQRSFCRLDPVAQTKWLDGWSTGYGLLAGSFVKLLRNCSLFAYFDHPLVVAQLEASDRRAPISDAPIGGAAA